MNSDIPKGLQEVLASKKISLADKIKCIQMWTYGIWHIDDEPDWYEPPAITKEQAKELIHELR